MSNLDGTVTTTVSIIGADAIQGPGEYPTMLTIAGDATVMPQAYAAIGVTSSIDAAALDNLGSVTGGPGAQVNLLVPTLPLDGGIGVYFDAFGSVTNAGTLAGGLGGANAYPLIQTGGNGGIGVELIAGGALTNTGAISGGAGGASPGTGGNGGIGVSLAPGDGVNTSTLVNGGSIIGGGGGAGGRGGGYGADGLDLPGGAMAGPTLHNQGRISGGAGGYGVSYGRPGALGVELSSGATLSNDTGGFIVGGAGGNAGAANGGRAGGAGISVAGSQLINATGAYVLGGAGGNGAGGSGAGDGAPGGSGVVLNDGALLDNQGTIQGGSSVLVGGGGAGVYLNDATLTTSGLIAGGLNGDRSFADAVRFGVATATLIVEPGATFIGQVAAHAAAGDGLELAGNGSTAPTLSGGLGSQFTGFSTLNFDPGAGWTLDTNSAAVQALTSIKGVDATDTIDITDLPYVAGATATFANEVLSIQDGTADLALVVDGGYGPHQFSLTPDGTGAGGTGGTDITLQAACYRRGTRIRTTRGDVPIEHLAVGDRVVTAAGAERAVRWLGSRGIDCYRYPDPSMVWPIRIRAGAFADGQPVRDLWVSPGHCIYIDGVLIQAEKLVNGASILRVPRARVEYWHLELDSHDIVLAEGLPAESYLDTGNRTAFINGGEFIDAFPDVEPKDWTDTCAPLVKTGAALQSARARLLARSRALGHAITHDAAVHVVADGERIDPLRLGERRLVFIIAPGRRHIELRCRTFIPANTDPASNDTRALGICVGRLLLDGLDVPLDGLDVLDGGLNDGVPIDGVTPGAVGWHELERHADGRVQRWTRAHVPLPPGTRLVLIDLAALSHCWAIPSRSPTRSAPLATAL